MRAPKAKAALNDAYLKITGRGYTLTRLRNDSDEPILAKAAEMHTRVHRSRCKYEVAFLRMSLCPRSPSPLRSYCCLGYTVPTLKSATICNARIVVLKTHQRV